MSGALKSEAVLVTGAASGIGAAVARVAAERGYDVVLLDLDGAGVQATTETLRALGVHVWAYEVDVSSSEAVSEAVQGSRGKRPRIGGVAACAGIEVLGDVTTLTTADWARSLNVNLTGVFNTAQATIEELLDGGGSFVAVASDAGVTGAQGYSAYCAAKHGVVGLVRAMSLDYGPRAVRVNAVAPGFVETPMAARIFESEPGSRSYYERTVPLQRFAQPAEVAAAVMHLLSPESSYTNGHVYRIDGGSTAGYFSADEG